VSRRATTTAVDMYLRERLGVRDIQTVADGKTDYADLPDGRGSVRVTAFQDYGGDDRSRYSDGSAMSTAPAAVFTPARVRAWRGLMIDVRVERRRRRRAQRSDCRRGGDLHRSIDGPRPCPDPNRLDHPGVFSDDMERTCRTTGHSASATRITLPQPEEL